MQLAGVPMMLLFLKARQLGVSTLFQFIINHLVNFRPYTTAIVASGDEDKTRKLLDKMIGAQLKLTPFWLIHPSLYQEPRRSGDAYLQSTDPLFGSMITVQHGRQELGIARGDTADAFHMTELLEWLNPEALIQASFLRAVHATERTFGVFETTASPRDAWMHRFWEECERDYPLGLTMVRPVFLPYFIGRDIYPAPGEERAMPVPDNWDPPEFVKEHAAKCAEYAQSSPILRKILPANWQMDPGQQWWYYREYIKNSADPQKFAQWLAEVPSSAKEAFQSWSRSVINVQTLQGYQRRLREPIYPPLMIDGPEIPELSKPVLNAGEEPALTVTHNFGGGRNLRWRLFALDNFTNTSDELDPLHKLWLWELPQLNQKYVVGVDCGEGIGRDRTVIQVFKLGNPYQPTTQVAEYASDMCNAQEAFGLVLMLARLYTAETYQHSVQPALVSIETAKGGSALIAELLKYGWENIYIRQKLDKRQRIAHEEPNYGWETNVRTRGILIDWIVKLIKQHNIVINSPWLLDEIKDFGVHVIRSQSGGQDRVKVEATRNCFDDRIFAAAIAAVTGHQLEIYRDDIDQFWLGQSEHAKKQVRLADHSKSVVWSDSGIEGDWRGYAALAVAAEPFVDELAYPDF